MSLSGQPKPSSPLHGNSSILADCVQINDLSQVLMTSIYYQNWVNVFPFIPQKDGSAAFYINAGTKGLAAHDVADIGATAAGDTACSVCSDMRLPGAITAFRLADVPGAVMSTSGCRQ
jgi:hypothetical protein